MSHAHHDNAYVKRLRAWLSSNGVPHWSYADQQIGSRYVREIQRRIRDAAGVVVIMSPVAASSDWVEREVLETLFWERPIFPILVAGERFFLLNERHRFDARRGDLPGAADLAEMRSWLDATERAIPTEAGWLGDTTPGAVPATDRPPILARVPDRPSLERLDTYLAEGLTAFADIMTTALLLDVTRRSREGWLREADGERLGFDLLTAIDGLWADRSGGRHGFAAQLAVHPRAPARVRPGGTHDFSALAAAVGWRRDTRTAIPPYAPFLAAEPHPDGFFPTYRYPQIERRRTWHRLWTGTAMAVHLRLRRWSDHT